MYGLVNRAIEDLATSLGGEPLWAEICHRAGLEALTFVGLDAYDDELTYQLVEAASQVLKMPASGVLEAFGEHWVRYTGREGFGPILAAYGSTVGEFLGNLDNLHARVKLTMPGLQPPSFRVEQEGENTYVVHYLSTRAGLGAMVVGLLRGIGGLFDREVEVEWTARAGDGAEHDVFRLTDRGPGSGVADGAASLTAAT